MKVHFFANLRRLTGRPAMHLEPAAALTVRQALEAVAERYPATRSLLFEADGHVPAAVPLYLNGRNPRLLPLGLETVLAPTDVLSLFSPISSGRMNVEALHPGAPLMTAQGHINED